MGRWRGRAGGGQGREGRGGERAGQRAGQGSVRQAAMPVADRAGQGGRGLPGTAGPGVDGACAAGQGRQGSSSGPSPPPRSLLPALEPFPGPPPLPGPAPPAQVIVQLAKSRGIHTVNVIRDRPDRWGMGRGGAGCGGALWRVGPARRAGSWFVCCSPPEYALQQVGAAAVERLSRRPQRAAHDSHTHASSPPLPQRKRSTRFPVPHLSPWRQAGSGDRAA